MLADTAHKPDIQHRRNHTTNRWNDNMIQVQLVTETGEFQAYFQANMFGILTTNWLNVIIMKSARTQSQYPLYRNYDNAQFGDALKKAFMAHSSPAIPIPIYERSQQHTDFVKIAKIEDTIVHRVPIPIRFTIVTIKAALTVNGFVRDTDGDHLPSDLIRELLSYCSYKYEATAIYPRIWDVCKLNHQLTGVTDISILQYRTPWTMDKITTS